MKSETMRLTWALLACAVSTLAAPLLAQQVTNENAIAVHGANISEKLDPAVNERGRQVYDGLCAACHNTGANRAPERFILQQLTPEAIYRTLDTGVMKPMAAALSDEERKSVAQHLAGRAFGPANPIEKSGCDASHRRFDFNQPPEFAGWGVDTAATHRIPDKLAGIDRANVGRLKLKWAFGFPESQRMRSQPAFAGGAVFIGSHNGRVYALDMATGCKRWEFQASAEVRTGIITSTWHKGDNGSHPRIYFGDMMGNAYALDSVSGRQVWRIKADPHPSATLTGTPVLHDGMLYIPVSSLEESPAANPAYPCCTFRGSMLAVDPATGTLRWRTWFTDPPKAQGKNSQGVDRFAPSGVATWSSPALDAKRGLLYVATGDNYSSPASANSDAILALDLKSGRIRWSYQALSKDAWNLACIVTEKANCPDDDGPDFDFGAGPVLAKGTNGKDYVLAGQKSGMAYALAPDTGTLVWKARVGRGGINGGVHFAVAAADGRFLVPISDVSDRRAYTMPPRPGIFALDVANGKELWAAADTDTTCGTRRFCKFGYAGTLSATSQLVMAGGSDGYLRIFDTRDGKLLWQTDTTVPVTTVNAVPAQGGAMSGATGPVAYHGMLFVPSGYGFTSKMPGNVLLVYAP